MANPAKTLQIDLLEQDRFYQLAPHKPYCTDDKTAGLRIVSKEKAFQKKYIQHNPPALCHWLTFDQDHEDILRWEKMGLPEPNLIVRNQDNRRAHVSYAIESVCTSPEARPKPLAFAAAVQSAYCTQLAADRCYTGLITKNPYNDNWSSWYAHDHVYTLNELADCVELERVYWTRQRAANLDHYGLGRNCALFHRSRFWAYDNVTIYREQGCSYNQWMQAVLDQVESFNLFEDDLPLPYSEVRSVAKSVGKWVWVNYWPTSKTVRRGSMAATFAASQIDLDLTTRQRLSARRTNDLRRSATDQQIDQVIQHIQDAGQQATKKAIAKQAGLSFETVKDRKAGISRSDYLNQANDKRQQAIKLRQQGMSQRQIAKELGISKTAVHHYLKNRK